MTLGSTEMDPNSGLPYGFFHHPMEGLPDGYPVLVSSTISEKRALETLQYIQYGGLLNREATESLSLQMVTYDPIAIAFGLYQATLKWLKSGEIVMTLNLKVADRNDSRTPILWFRPFRCLQSYFELPMHHLSFLLILFCSSLISIWNTQALPAVEYSSNIHHWRASLMVPDLVMLVLIAVYTGGCVGLGK